MDAFLFPELSGPTQALFRTATGVLLLAFLIQALPLARWFFLSERWRGYAESRPGADALQNPAAMPVVLAVWIACAVALIVGFQTVLASLINLLLCRYFFVHMRWKGLLRGGGAPGAITYWLAACVFFLEYARHLDPQGVLAPAALLAFKLDFAFIMLNAGLYKVFAGYPRNQGMEYGMVNPWWGYWSRFTRNIPPGHIMFRTSNHLAYGTEIVGAILMIIPATEWIGALMIMISFVWIATQIRLGVLCEMVIVCGLLFFRSGGPLDAAIASFAPAGAPAPQIIPALPAEVHLAVRWMFWGYAALLPLAHAGLFVTLLGKRRLPTVLQTVLDGYCAFFGITIWRVFTVDIVNFFVRVTVRNPATGSTRPYAFPHAPGLIPRARYWHVCEFVCLASVFTTLKYFRSKPELFQDRLVRYARTIPVESGEQVVFEYVSVQKEPERFAFVPVAEFTVDPAARKVEERTLSDIVDIRAAHPVSPVREGIRPGSYTPAATDGGDATPQPRA